MKTNNNPRFSELKVRYRKMKLPTKLDSTYYSAFYLRQIWDKSLISIQEQFYVVFLNQNMEVIGWRNLNTGTGTECLVDVKLLSAIALQCLCCNVILAHNHPSGNLRPSKADETLTWRIASVLKLFDIKILDHIILTIDGYYSFADHNIMSSQIL